jgi:hypothetical protein
MTHSFLIKTLTAHAISAVLDFSAIWALFLGNITVRLVGRTFFRKVCHGSYNRIDIIPGSLPSSLLGRTVFPKVCQVRYQDAEAKSDRPTKRTLLQQIQRYLAGLKFFFKL